MNLTHFSVMSFLRAWYCFTRSMSQPVKVKEALFDEDHCKLACLLKDLTFKAYIFVLFTCIDLQLENQLFIFVTS